MRKNLIKVVLSLLLVVPSLVVVSSTPASATHMGSLRCAFTDWSGSDNQQRCAHWGNGYSPPVYTNHSPNHVFATGQSVRSLTEDAGYFWQDRYFTQGWNPGAFPAQFNTNGPCDPIRGAINLCFVPWNSPLLSDGLGGFKRGTVLLYNFNHCDTACNHIQAAVTVVSHNQSALELQRTTRHELGHALGLGHNEHCCTTSIMKANPDSMNADTHDVTEMWNIYVGHTQQTGT